MRLLSNIVSLIVLNAILVLSFHSSAFAQQGSWTRKDYNTDNQFHAEIAYGAPGQTDIFWASCGNNPTMGLAFGVDSSGFADGSHTQVQVIAGGAGLNVDAQVATSGFRANTLIAYTTFDQSIWQAMVSADSMTLGIPGKNYDTIDLNSGREIIRNFVGICAHYQSLIGQTAQANAPAAQPAAPGFDPNTYAQQFNAVWTFASSSHANCPGCSLVIGVSGSQILGSGTNCELIQADATTIDEASKTARGTSSYTGPAVPTLLHGMSRNAALSIQNGQLVIDYGAASNAIGGGLSGNMRDIYTKSGPNNGINPNTNICSGGTSPQFVAAMTGATFAAAAPNPTPTTQPAFPTPTPQPAAPTPTPQQTVTSPSPQLPSESPSIASQIALGVLAAGAAIIADEVDQLFTEAPAPAAPATTSTRTIHVRVNSVYAVETTFGLGGDEVFLLASNGSRAPAGNSNYHDINSGESWSPNAQFSGTGGLSVDLREWDSFNASDLIGNFSVDANHAAGNFSTTLRGDGAVYEIGYQVEFRGGTTQTAQPRPSTQPVAQQSAPTPRRSWSANGAYENIIVTDCRDDCEEDIGILFACRGLGLPASVSVPWVSIDNGREGETIPLFVDVHGQSFSYNAVLGPSGLVGHIPSFFVNPGDPLIEALASGNNVQVSFAGTSANIGLRGSRDALEVFKAHCEWNSVPQGTQFADGFPIQQSQPQPEEQPFWFNSQFADYDTNQLTHNLVFGIPETDAVGVSATCQPNSANPNIILELMVDFGFRSNFEQVDAYVLLDGSAHEFVAEVFIGSSEYAGVRASVSPQSLLWRQLQNAQTIVYGVVGAGQGRANSSGVNSATQSFLSACQPSRPAVVTPVAPIAPQAPIATQPTAQNPGATQGIFICDDGSTLSIALSQAGTASVANILQTDGTQTALIEVPSNVGAKFSNGIATLNLAGSTAHFSNNGVSRFCQAN